MAALRQEHRYGLSCGKNHKNAPTGTLYHVKLTDTAIRALEAYQNRKGSFSNQPAICFKENQGYIKIPALSPDSQEALRVFSFSLSSDSKDKPQASLDCIQQYVSSDGREELECQGSIQDKITVCATDDSYKVTRERMSQVEKDILGRSAIEIKPGPPYQGKCVKVQKKAGQASGPDGLSKLSPTYKRSCPAGSAGVTVHRPLRERLIHLLALKPYRKPELLLWLERERASPREKAELAPILEEVAKQNPRDQSFTLKDDMYPLVQRDWPGYQDEERRLVNKLLTRKLQPAVSSSQSKSFQSNTPFPRSLGESPSHLSPVKSPAVKRPVPSDSLENQTHKKSRVLQQSFRPRRLSGDPQPAGDHRGPTHSSKSPPPAQAEPRPESLGIELGGDSPSASAQQHKRRKSRKQKEKEREREEWRKGSEEHKQPAPVEDHESVNTPASPTVTEELPDYLLKYHTITGLEQRQKYKDDFCAEYDEYRNLHSRIGSVIEMFVRLGSKIKTLSPGTQEYKVMEEQILEKYQKYRKKCPGYREEKKRCEYLHQKLAHIKGLILDYDRAQMPP
ncbi:RNA polymerase II elongation factor ELL2 [Brienomyrus brachyistius]|uniref:RNA polymerase II elongation factor ELL2 n=1 Tax=Brienomyrus brachyistius TaxID=42636 RepID=UPI0020B20F2E|nr:RNA polymerase II elongation factor ELL2 [Brienomyrus brachyistius]